MGTYRDIHVGGCLCATVEQRPGEVMVLRSTQRLVGQLYKGGKDVILPKRYGFMPEV
jgi:hypothetical protein